MWHLVPRCCSCPPAKRHFPCTPPFAPHPGVCPALQYACMFISANEPGNVKKIQASVTAARKIFRVFRVSWHRWPGTRGGMWGGSEPRGRTPGAFGSAQVVLLGPHRPGVTVSAPSLELRWRLSACCKHSRRPSGGCPARRRVMLQAVLRRGDVGPGPSHVFVPKHRLHPTLTHLPTYLPAMPPTRHHWSAPTAS